MLFLVKKENKSDYKNIKFLAIKEIKSD